METKKSIVQKLREEAKPFSSLFALSLVFMFFSGFANILPSWLIKVSVDGLSALSTNNSKFSLFPTQLEKFLLEKFPNGINLEFFSINLKLEDIKAALYVDTSTFSTFLPLAIIIVFSLDAIFKFTYLFSIRSWGLKVVKSIREKFHAHLNKLSIKDQVKYDSGSLVSIVSSDLTSLQSWLSESVTNFFNDGFKALFLFTWLLILNYKLTLLAIITIPLFAFPVIKIGKSIRKYSKGGQDHIGRIGSFLNETLVNQRIIKAFNLEEWREAAFKKESGILYKLQSRWFLFMSLVSPVTNIVAALGISAILYFGLQSVNNQSISLGEFTSFFVTCILLFDPAKRIGRVATIFQSALGVAERVFNILDEKSQEDEVTDDTELKLPMAASVEFKGLVFEYESLNDSEIEAKRIFNNLNLYIPAKSSMALVGPSGSGKTTLISLLPRFYEINAGEILIDGLNIRDLSLKTLRRYIAFVSQDPLLFTGTLRENLMVACEESNPEKLDAEIKSALAKAFLDEVVDKLPQGLDTHIGERGQSLSLGQRQRVSLARAFLCNAPIVILDEPTSALDNRSQQYIYDSIQKLMEERTVLVIAHRLDTIKSCDQIVYLENGEILEKGTYQELLDKKSDFADLLSSGEA
ncbi:MAG: ABC transporter ATP-binding protein [Candidatus Caenarcaniphilales bacterium]|nr:ABC transporter ATP-binding protein [Candidatus Caenarcaniphilales bacterium]